MDKELIKNVIVDQRETIIEKLKKERIIEREGLSYCKKFISSPNVLLISGVRRAGKSFFAHLLLHGKKYAYLNYDDERLIELKTKDLNTVMECFYELYSDFEYILFDEIQNIKGWELFINRLREKYKIVITGSNANLLSKELATHLTGRFIDFVVFPLSFREFLKYNSVEIVDNLVYSTKIRSKVFSLFVRYLSEGGFFEYYKFGKEFLRNLFNSIITKDIAVRYRIKHPHVLEELALLLVNYFTSKISINNLTRHLTIKSPHTVKAYIKYLENSFAIFSINKFSYKIKEQLASFKKIYTVDNGLINSLIFKLSENKGRLLENMVANEFKRRAHSEGIEVFYWSNYNVECDFIIKKTEKVISAYQVCSEITLSNEKREINGLIAALKEFKLKEGSILTDSTEKEIVVENYKIKIIPIWKWILSKGII